MIDSAKSAFQSTFLSFNIYCGHKTKSNDILELMKKLHPMHCGIELIRVGPNGDGGYLIPNDLDGIKYCFSPGIDTIVDFENQLAERGIHSFLADHSIEMPPIMRPEFTFDKKFLGAFDHENYVTLDTWKNKYLAGHGEDLILQMDIEGSEYEVVLSMSDDLLRQFRIIIIEFHHLDKLFDSFVFQIYRSCFEKILKYFRVAHIHPNNCAGLIRNENIVIPPIAEFTFFNANRVASLLPRHDFPHPLDQDNTANKHIILPPCWHE